MRTAFLSALLAILLGGCGLKGNLYLPPAKQPAPTSAPQPAPDASAETRDVRP